MTTYIVDNGGDYSDHHLYFVNTTLLSPIMDALVKVACYAETAEVLADSTINIVLSTQFVAMTLTEFLENCSYRLDDKDCCEEIMEKCKFSENTKKIVTEIIENHYKDKEG